MIGMCGGSGGNSASEVSGGDGVAVGSAGAANILFRERINAAGTHVAYRTAQSQIAKGAQRQHGFMAFPDGGNVQLPGMIVRAYRGGIGGFDGFIHLS
jgi:hypothetical protein